MKTLNVSIDRAREWYNGSDEALRKLALECYSVDELELMQFEKIKSIYDAVIALNMDIDDVFSTISAIERTSKASAAMYKLNIVHKALNLGYDLSAIKQPKYSVIYYPNNPFITKSSTYYDNNLNSGVMNVIGRFKIEGKEYNVIGGTAYTYGGNFSSFDSECGVGDAHANFGFFGCANKKIAEHFSKYFGMLITVAKYGDFPDFEITYVA